MKTIIPYALTIGLLLASCSPTLSSTPEEVEAARQNSSLEKKLGEEITGNYIILQTSNRCLDQREEANDIGEDDHTSFGYCFEVALLTLRPQDSSDIKDYQTMIYPGISDFILNVPAKIAYRPITGDIFENDIVGYFQPNNIIPEALSQKINGVHGPVKGYVIGVEYISPE